MNITEEQVRAIIGDDDTYGIIIVNLRRHGGMEIACAADGGISADTLKPLGEAAAQAIIDTARGMKSCQCPKCQAAKALSNNAPIAQA